MLFQFFNESAVKLEQFLHSLEEENHLNNPSGFVMFANKTNDVCHCHQTQDMQPWFGGRASNSVLWASINS